jgi:hypothetical protein
MSTTGEAREKVLDEVFTNLADQGWDVSMADDPVKGLSILVQPVQLTPEALALAQNIVNQVLGGAVECGAYVLADMTKRQEFNDVADAFVTRLITPTAQPVQVEITDGMVEQVTAEVYKRLDFESGEAGFTPTVENVVRAALDALTIRSTTERGK